MIITASLPYLFTLSRLLLTLALIFLECCMMKLYIRYGFGRWEEKLVIAALYLGIVGNICLAFLFFPVARGSAVLPLLGLTSESSIKYHIWLGNAVMVLFTAHGVCFIIFWAVTHQLSEVILIYLLLSLSIFLRVTN